MEINIRYVKFAGEHVERVTEAWQASCVAVYVRNGDKEPWTWVHDEPRDSRAALEVKLGAWRRLADAVGAKLIDETGLTEEDDERT